MIYLSGKDNNNSKNETFVVPTDLDFYLNNDIEELMRDPNIPFNAKMKMSIVMKELLAQLVDEVEQVEHQK